MRRDCTDMLLCAKDALNSHPISLVMGVIYAAMSEGYQAVLCFKWNSWAA